MFKNFVKTLAITVATLWFVKSDDLKQGTAMILSSGNDYVKHGPGDVEAMTFYDLSHRLIDHASMAEQLADEIKNGTKGEGYFVTMNEAERFIMTSLMENARAQIAVNIDLMIDEMKRRYT